MTANAESYIQLPDDTSNTGKKVRTQSRVVGAHTVHIHDFVPISTALIKGIYYSTSTLYSITASANNGTSVGIWWLQVPLNATVNARIRRIDLTITNAVATVVDHNTVPRFAFARFTHVGGWSGATQAISKRRTSDSNSQVDIRTATTGTTVSLVNSVWATLVPGMVLDSSGVANLCLHSFWRGLHDDEFIDLAPGEGLVGYQVDAATTSDHRRLITNICWDEYDNT